MNAWDYTVLALQALAVVSNIYLVGKPRTGHYTAGVALVSIVWAGIVWMAVAT